MNSPTPPPSLTGHHLRTYEAIFRHPVSHNLAWHDVHALLGRIANVTEEPNGNLKITRNGQLLVLRPQRSKEVSEVSELMELRHFLQRSENPLSHSSAKKAHWVVIIDHREARVFRSEEPGAVAQQILPHEPDAYFRHAHKSKDFSRGMEKPDPNSFFEPVAVAVKEAGDILALGNGKGSGSEMEQFIAWLKQHRPEIAGRIVGSLVVDEHHLTEAQLLEKARDFYAALAAPRAAQPQS